MLIELEAGFKQRSPGPGSDGRRTNTPVYQLIQQSKQPEVDPELEAIEALFCSGEEALAAVEPGSLDVPIFTKGEQQFQWKSGERPISQLFRRMEDLDRTTSVQIPSRKSSARSFAM